MKNSALFSFLLIFISAGMICHAQEFFDVETLPCSRTKQFSPEPYKKIIVFSAPRTGSSLVYNLFRFLFEDGSKIFSHHFDFNQDRLVLKTHKIADLDLVEEDNVLYIFTIRNPLNACISNYRICPRKITDNRAFAEQLINKHRNYLILSEKMKNDGMNVVLLKYEDFTDNLDYLFDYIENHFQISIDSMDKVLMKKGYSKENICFCTRNLADFKEFLPYSGFHGRHVNLEAYTPPEEFSYWLNVYLEDIKPLFKNYGYFSDSL